jgi:hypothetical protein
MIDAEYRDRVHAAAAHPQQCGPDGADPFGFRWIQEQSQLRRRPASSRPPSRNAALRERGDQTVSRTLSTAHGRHRLAGQVPAPRKKACF